MAGVLDTSPAARAVTRGWSDLTIRNVFIIPTILFLIIFNIFPLIYSLGYSFTDFRASVNEPANFVGLQNFRELLTDERIWNNFWVTAKYVIVSVGGQMTVGFGLALLLNRAMPAKGLITTLLLLPMMMSAAVVGLFWRLLYDPSWGPLNYALGLGDLAWLSNADLALYAVAITDIWMWAPFVMLLSLAGLSAVPIAPGATLDLHRHEWCLFLSNIHSGLEADMGMYPASLKFRHAGTIEVEFMVDDAHP